MNLLITRQPFAQDFMRYVCLSVNEFLKCLRTWLPIVSPRGYLVGMSHYVERDNDSPIRFLQKQAHNYVDRKISGL